MKILLTGASRGIGLFLMRRLLNSGFDAYGTYNNTIPSVDFMERLTQVNVADHKQVNSWFKSVVNTNDQLIAINCAGTNYNSFAHKANPEQWKNVVDVNLIGSFNLINIILPHMRQNGFGRIINFSSVVAQKGIPGTSAYAASKSALWGLSKSIAAENSQNGITINNLNLGYFDIGMVTLVPELLLEGIKKAIPSQKLGNPDNIYNAVLFIVENEYINGTSIDINGGLY